MNASSIPIPDCWGFPIVKSSQKLPGIWFLCMPGKQVYLFIYYKLFWDLSECQCVIRNYFPWKKLKQGDKGQEMISIVMKIGSTYILVALLPLAYKLSSEIRDYILFSVSSPSSLCFIDLMDSGIPPTHKGFQFEWQPESTLCHTTRNDSDWHSKKLVQWITRKIPLKLKQQ